MSDKTTILTTAILESLLPDALVRRSSIGDDVDNCTETGIYRVESMFKNNPTRGSALLIVCRLGLEAIAFQILFGHHDGSMQFRSSWTRPDFVWSNWHVIR